MIKLRKINNPRKIVKRKTSSMENIKQNKEETVFITLKRVKSYGNINKKDIRKIKSNDIKNKV